MHLLLDASRNLNRTSAQWIRISQPRGGIDITRDPKQPGEAVLDREVPPAWKALMEYCRQLQHGEIERLRIQDGLPVIAEVITQKIKFTK